MKTRVSLSVLGGALVAASFVGAQPPPSAPAQEATPQFKAGTEVVALDLVVRDKKGKLVTDLQEGEIEVLEDGVPQKLTSFRAVPPAPSAGVAPGAAAPSVGTEGAARRVVLAFDRLSSDGRRLAQSAGDEFARKHVAPPTVVTVVRVDNGLIPVLDRTSDPAAVKEAVRKATGAIGTGAAAPAGPSVPTRATRASSSRASREAPARTT